MDTVKYVLEAEGLYELECVRELGLVKLLFSYAVMLVKIKHWDAFYALLNTQIKVVAEYAFF